MLDKNIKIEFVIRPIQHQINYSNLLSQGMRKHGYKNIRILQGGYNPSTNPDLVLIWAHKKTDIIQNQRKRNRPYIVMERAYIGDRHKWVSIGYNGLNGKADFLNKNIDSLDRWNLHFKNYLKPWKYNKNGYVLVCGQVPNDASHRHINIINWYTNVIRQLKKMNEKIVFRQHPLDKKNRYSFIDNKTVFLDKNKTLEDSLKEAKACVTFSSNSGVISLLHGIPTVAYDKISMVYDYVSNDINNLIQTPDRTEWCKRIAYTQWLPEELKNGVAWEHLKNYEI